MQTGMNEFLTNTYTKPSNTSNTYEKSNSFASSKDVEAPTEIFGTFAKMFAKQVESQVAKPIFPEGLVITEETSEEEMALIASMILGLNTEVPANTPKIVTEEEVKVIAEVATLGEATTKEDKGTNVVAKASEGQAQEGLMQGDEPKTLDKSGNAVSLETADVQFVGADVSVNQMKEVITAKPAVISAPEGLNAEQIDNIKAEIARNISAGNGEFEIVLTPESLGKLTIKASYENGNTLISIICSDPETMEVLAKNAVDIASFMETRSGNATQVIVETPAKDYLQQHDGNEPNQNGKGDGNEQSQKEKQSYEENSNFLEQLRLGLL